MIQSGTLFPPEVVNAPNVRRLSQSLIIGLLAVVTAVVIIVMNHAFELKDREIYQYYFDSLSSCTGLGCLLISDSVRSPTFLSLLIIGQRAGVPFDLVFTFISVASLAMFFAGVKATAHDSAVPRLLLVSIALGPWLYLIQVKLFLAVGLYMYSRSRRGRFARVALAICSILTHESIVVFMVLDYLWHMRGIRIDLKATAIVIIAGSVLLVWLGDVANVVWSAITKIQQYNDYASRGEVPPLARVGSFSALFLLFGLVGLLKVGRNPAPPDGVRMKELAWMFSPWIILMILAFNELIAVRIAELAMLHALIVAPIGRSALGPLRLGLLVFAMTFGGLTMVRDVLLA